MINRLLEGIYMPHGYCLAWEPWLITLHAASDFLTFCAYSAIPVAIWIFVSKRKDLELKPLARLFAAFILWCGLTHLFGLITLWYPVYEIQGIVKGVTATVSLMTAFLIFPLIPRALAVPSPRQLQSVNAQLQAEISSHRATLDDLQAARAELEDRVAQRTEELRQATERFRALFQHAPVAMVMAGQEGEIEQANARALAMFGTTRDILMSQRLGALLPDADIEKWLVDNGPDAAKDENAAPAAESRAQRLDGTEFPVEIGINSLPAGPRRSYVVSLTDISERRRQQERDRVVMRELSHRAKNLLAVIQGMARQAIASSPDLETFQRSFRDRLQGLSRSHELLVGANWGSVSLAELLQEQVGIVEGADRSAVSIEGPAIMLSPEATQTIGLAIHELLTNALKYGALAENRGTVNIHWKIDSGDGAPRVRFVWQEATKAPVAEPARRGFGRTVLERVVPTSLQGSAVVDFTETGFRWSFDTPLSALTG